MKGLGLALRIGGTTLLLGTIALRVLRIAGNRESVTAFYMVDSGLSLPWRFLFAALFLGPFITALIAATALWLDQKRAAGLAAVNFLIAGFFVLEEGLTVFARAVNGNSAYVGAEPLFSLLVCAVSGAAVLGIFWSQHREWKKKRRNDYDVY